MKETALLVALDNAERGAASARSAPGAPGAPPSSATQVPSSAPNPFVEGILGHLAFLQPEAVAAQNRWMDDVDHMFRD